jgi:uncharacterized lipoprotein YajG
LKAEDKLREVLPQVLEHFTAEGYHFGKLNEQELITHRAKVSA